MSDIWNVSNLNTVKLLELVGLLLLNLFRGVFGKFLEFELFPVIIELGHT
jgi:hypothetical protein